MDIEKRLIKVQARLDAILYNEHGVKPRIEDYFIYDMDVKMSYDEAERDWPSMVDYLSLLFSIVDDNPIRSKILDYVDRRHLLIQEKFYTPFICSKEYLDLKIHLLIAERESGKAKTAGIYSSMLIENTPYKEVVEKMLGSKKTVIIQFAQERLEKDFGDT
ncbi:MAG: hypothetical protein AAGG75_22425 [Bacteroidota bacterium]